MIQLTRLRQNTPFILNPDLIERVDTHVDTVVRLTSGTEYVVNESGDEIVRRTIEFRARVLSLAGAIDAVTPLPDDDAPVPAPVPEAAAETAPDPAPETVWAPADEIVEGEPGEPGPDATDDGARAEETEVAS